MKRVFAFVAIAATIGVAACTTTTTGGAGAAASAITDGVPLIPREVIFGNPEKANVRMSWDGKRIYFTSSLLANWDKKQAGNSGDLQFFKAYTWNGKKLNHEFTIDFLEAKLGSPHQMRFGAYSLY